MAPRRTKQTKNEYELDIVVLKVLKPNGKEECFVKWSDTPTEKYPFDPTSTYALQTTQLHDRHMAEFERNFMHLTSEEIYDLITSVRVYNMLPDVWPKADVYHLVPRRVEFERAVRSFRSSGKVYEMPKVERYFLFNYYCLLLSIGEFEPYQFENNRSELLVKYVPKKDDDEHRYLQKDFKLLCECLIMMPKHVDGF